MLKVELEEAQRRLSELLEEAAGGQEIVISRGDGASFRLVPFFEQDRGPRKAGGLKGRIHIADDFDDPLPDFEEYM